jgi:hypothetical protein
MAVSQESLNLIYSLNGESPQTVVRVVVRPSIPHGETTERVETSIDPKQFASPTDYRSALIARQKQRTQPAKDALVTTARQLGLDASAAGALNAVLVEGEVGQMVRLLEQGGIESATLETHLPG